MHGYWVLKKLKLLAARLGLKLQLWSFGESRRGVAVGAFEVAARKSQKVLRQSHPGAFTLDRAEDLFDEGLHRSSHSAYFGLGHLHFIAFICKVFENVLHKMFWVDFVILQSARGHRRLQREHIHAHMHHG